MAKSQKKTVTKSKKKTIIKSQKTTITKKKSRSLSNGKSSCAKVLQNKKSLTNGKSSCAKVFQNVMNTAQKSKLREFSFRKKSVELSDSLKKSIKEPKKSKPVSHLEFKSCFIQLSRVPTNNFANKSVEIKKSPKQKPTTIKKTESVKRKTTREVCSQTKSSSVENRLVSIPLEIENEINNYAKEALTLGWSLMRKNMPFFIQHCLNKHELDLFSSGLKLLANNLPSAPFVRMYIRKYEVIYKDILEDKLANTLTAMDEKNIFYFNLCWHLINKYAIRSESFLNAENKNRIFCCGDFSFPCDYRNIVEITDGLTNTVKKKGENVFFCSSATGKVLNPLIINKGITVKAYESSIYADNKYWQQSSGDGLMCAEAFHLWLITSLKPHIDDERIQRPVILFFNADSPYLSIPVLDFCREHEIILFAIPAQFAGVLNPFYMSCFDKLSLEYSRIFRKRVEETVGKAREFCPLILIAAMDRVNFTSLALAAFEQSGLLKKESYSRETEPVKKASAKKITIEDRLPTSLKNSSYKLGKEVGKLMCYHEILSCPDLQLKSGDTTDAQKKFFTDIKNLYLRQSEKCTDMLDYHDDEPSYRNIRPEVKVKSSFKNAAPFTMTTLNAENIFRVQPPQIKQKYSYISKI